MSPRRVLVVADHGDLGARAAARAASSSLAGPTGGGDRVLVAAGADLAAARWRHEVTAYGEVSTTLWVPGVGELTDQDLAGALVRPCDGLVPPGLVRAPRRDRAYASAELAALISSWLLSLGARVVNAPEGASPWGPTWVPERWLSVAAEAGFTIGSDVPDRRVLVAGRHVVGAVDDAERRGAGRLADRSGCRLLEISLAGRQVTAVSCVPVLLDPAHIAATGAALADLARDRTGVAA